MTAVAIPLPLERARRALAEAENLPDITKLVEYAEAMRVAVRRARLGEESQRDWARFSLDAQREAGRMLAEMPKARNQHDDASNTLKEALGSSTVGEANMKAKRWQDVFAVADDVYVDYRDNADEPTRARLLRLARDHAARAERERTDGLPPAPPDAIDLRTGDFRQVLADLSDVDAIITDPPYPREFLPLLGDLAVFADQVLAPDGVLAVLIGQSHLPDVYRLLDGGRPYRWTMCYSTPGAGYTSQARRLQSNWKPILVYGGGPRFNDVIITDRDDKTHHHWGQDFSGFTELVQRLTVPGAHVVDPFLGGGTTAVAARNSGRRFTGADIDLDAVTTTCRRLSMEAP